MPSVGATANILTAAVLAEGTTVINNAAIEPEVTSLGTFLNKMGAKINGIGTNILTIEGVNSLTPANETNIPDRIEAATYLIAAAATKGTVRINKCNPSHIGAILKILKEAGCDIIIKNDTIELITNELKSVDIVTGVYPGIPTDIQAQ